MAPTAPQELLKTIRENDTKSAREKMEEAKQHLHELSTDELKTLRDGIDAYQKEFEEMHVGRNAETEERERIVAELELAIEQVKTQPERVPATQEELSESMEQAKSGFEKFTEKIQQFTKNIVAILPLPMLKWLQSTLPEWMGKSFFGGIVEKKEILGDMERVLGKDTVKTTDQDEKFLEELHAQYDRLSSDKKGAMTFPQFVLQKIRLLKSKDGNRAEYTLQDVVNTQLDIEKESTIAAKGNKETDKEKEKKRTRRLKEVMDENPDVKAAVYTYALAQALSEFTTHNFGMFNGKEEMNKDLSGERPAREKYFAAGVREKIAEWMEDVTKSGATIGVTIDGGDLEESDGSNWFYDLDLATYFDPRNNIVDAVDKLLMLRFGQGNELADGWNINATARGKLPRLQTGIQNRLNFFLGELAPQVLETPAPATTDIAAATPAAAPTSAPAPTTPAGPAPAGGTGPTVA